MPRILKWWKNPDSGFFGTKTELISQVLKNLDSQMMYYKVPEDANLMKRRQKLSDYDNQFPKRITNLWSRVIKPKAIHSKIPWSAKKSTDFHRRRISGLSGFNAFRRGLSLTKDALENHFLKIHFWWYTVKTFFWNIKKTIRQSLEECSLYNLLQKNE